jgi:hypothetical protein
MGSSNSTEKKETNLNDYLTSLDLDFNNFEKQKMPVLDFKVGGGNNSYEKYNVSNLLNERENTLNGGGFNNTTDFDTSVNHNSLSVNVVNALNNIQAGGSNDNMRNVINDELKQIMNGGMGCKCDKNGENCKCGNDNSLSSTSSMDLSPGSMMGGAKKKKFTTSSTSITSDSSDESDELSSNDESTSSTSSSTTDTSTTMAGGSESDNSDNNMSIKRGISVFPFESSEADNSLSERNMRLLRKHL